jgi:hypothetical protein
MYSFVKFFKLVIVCVVAFSFVNISPIMADSECLYVNSFSNNSGWMLPARAYSNDGLSAGCIGGGDSIIYSFPDTSLAFQSGMFYICKIQIEWKVTDSGGGGGPFSVESAESIDMSNESTEFIEVLEDSPKIQNPGENLLSVVYLDKLCVSLYHKTTDSWTGWYGLANSVSGVWDTDSITESSKPWSPYDLDNLKVKLLHQYSPTPDRIDVDYVRLEVTDTVNWSFYLGSDWARHPGDSSIQNWVTNHFIDEQEKTREEEIQRQTFDEWDWDEGFYRCTYYPEIYNPFLTDTFILADREENGSYQFVCWHAAILLSSYYRADGTPSRIIYFHGTAGIHYSVEFWNGEDWIPSDCTNAENIDYG